MGPQNVFLQAPLAVEEAVEPVVQALSRHKGVLPACSQADADSYYGCGDGLDVETTQRKLLLRTGRVMVLARWLGFTDRELDPLLLADMHDGIFRPVFGDRTLGFRQPPGRHEHRDDDGVVFPYWVIEGAGRDPELRSRRGVRANQVERRLSDACTAFERDVDESRGDFDRGALVIARLYARLIRIHPFGDGNGRTAWAAVQFAAGRLRLPFVKSSPTTAARVALGDALRHGQRIQPLADCIKDAMWDDGPGEERKEGESAATRARRAPISGER